MVDQPTPPFQQLDFVYAPSRDVAADLAYFTQILGGRVVFAVQAMGTRVAAIELTPGPPLLLLADHLGGTPHPGVPGGRPGRRPGRTRGPRLAAAADPGDPSWAVPLVSQSRRPPDRALSADGTRGGHPLRGAPRLLNAEACPLTRTGLRRPRAIDVRIGRTADHSPGQAHAREVCEPPVQVGQPHGGLRRLRPGSADEGPQGGHHTLTAPPPAGPNPVPDSAPGATRTTNLASHLRIDKTAPMTSEMIPIVSRIARLAMKPMTSRIKPRRSTLLPLPAPPLRVGLGRSRDLTNSAPMRSGLVSLWFVVFS
jgi:hypothetical protein